MVPAADGLTGDHSASQPAGVSGPGQERLLDRKALEERDRLMAALHEIAKMSLASLDLDEILDGAAQQIVSAGIFRSLMIALVDHDAKRVEVVRNFLSFEGGIMKAGSIKPGGVLLPIDHVTHNAPGHVRKDERIVGTAYDLDDDNITARVARTGQLQIIHGPSKDFDERVTDLRFLGEGHVSYFIPVNHGGRCIAVLATGSEADELDEMMHRIGAMGPLLDQFAIALEHAELFEEIRVSHRQLERVNKRLQEEIDERRRIDEQLRQSQKMQALGQLTAGVAHNFNNHLMAILGNLEYLEMAGVTDESLQLAQSAGLRAADMVRQLMLFSRTESKGVPRPVRLQSVLGDAIAIGRKTFDRSIVLDDELPEDLPTVSGDPGQLEQLFLNLLLNARDALEKVDRHTPRIEVVVDTATLKEEELSVESSSSPGRFVRISVRDNGSGMDEDTRRRVFDPFFTTKEVGEGTGLGLSTAYGVAHQHNGWIECSSEPGVGTTFLVLLPACEDEVPDHIAPHSQPARGGSETILVIEDEEMVRVPVVQVMESYGYTVVTAEDGKVGWEKFNHSPADIDLVFLDLSLPGLSGVEVLKRIRDSAPATRVIISTGHNDVGDIEAETILRKPYRVAEALESIRRVLDA